MRRLPALGLATLLAVGLSPGTGAGAAARHSRSDRLAANPGLFLNILPAGQGTTTTTADAAQYELNGTVPPHDIDQKDMYDSLRAADLPHLTDGDLTNYYKPESFGVTGGTESTESPQDGVTIKRDSFGVPHIDGDTRAHVEWGAGYAAAEDRLFMMDTLRNVGKGHLSEFLGPSPSNLAMDRAMYLVAGYSDDELMNQGLALRKYGPIGQQVINDVDHYIAGINARIDYDVAHPDVMPAEYPALQIVPEKWSRADVVAIATLIQSIFAGGGGNELGNALFLQRATAKYGAQKASALWRDLRAGDVGDRQLGVAGVPPLLAARHRGESGQGMDRLVEQPPGARLERLGRAMGVGARPPGDHAAAAHGLAGAAGQRHAVRRGADDGRRRDGRPPGGGGRPLALRILGQSSDPNMAQVEDILRQWAATGAHRVDRNGDGQYDDQAAVALMDAWWPHMVHDVFDPTLAGLYGRILLPLDDENRAAGLGSSFQGGYYGYLRKSFQMALGQPVAGPYAVLRCADGTEAGCRAALQSSLQAALDQLGNDPGQWNADEDADAIRYESIGLVGIPNSPWQNRPTFQQVVQVTAHRPR
jgi:hypothetical protein